MQTHHQVDTTGHRQVEAHASRTQRDEQHLALWILSELVHGFRSIVSLHRAVQPPILDAAFVEGVANSIEQFGPLRKGSASIPWEIGQTT
jgi:hypothetical protein